jgi:hypothetical protein
LRSNMLVACLVAVCLSASGCGDLGIGKGRSKTQGDPWHSAGVDRPQITRRMDGDRSVVSARAETSLPLEQKANQVGFGERAAKIIWRTHVGRVDVLELTVAQHDHPERTHSRTWQRSGLEAAFGPRFSGLDNGPASTPTQLPEHRQGPYHDKHVDNVTAGRQLLAELLAKTSREYYHADGTPTAGERTECLGGLDGTKPTGKYRVRLTLETTAPDSKPAVNTLEGLVTYWSRLGLQVATEDLYTGLSRDEIKATLPDIGTITASTPPPTAKDAHTVELSAETSCLKP